MRIIVIHPHQFRFDFNMLDLLVSYAYKNGYNGTEIHIEDIVESFFDVKLDYDEVTDEYIIYFETAELLTFFKLRYSEILCAH